MLPSFHDDYLVGYEVCCERREIKLHIRAATAGAEQADICTVVFTGVQGYRFENDAFGNVISALEAVPIPWFLSEYRDELSEWSRYGPRRELGIRS
jgi:hypothetical protein